MALLIRDERPFQAQTLRSYQEKAIAEVRELWGRGKRPLVPIATGGGKTTVLAEIVRQTIDPHTQRALLIGHTAEIVGQIHDRVANQFEGELSANFSGRGGRLFVPGLGIVMGENDQPDARIIAATRQSLHSRRLQRLLDTGPFDLIVIDEAHHALADNTYGAIVETLQAANPDLRLLGLTATPSRSDQEALGALFDEVCGEWLIPDGIAQGYLVPVTRLKVSTRVDVSGIRTNRGDYSQDKLVSALDASNWLTLCLEAYQQYIRPTDRLTLAFMPSVAMSRAFADALKAKGVPAAHLDGETPKDERRRILGQYTRGDLRVVSNMAVLTEGFDAPPTAAIFLGRPTRSRTLFTQIVGRGLRPFPGKHDCLLVDMTVVDTKALEVGTLLGKMTTCPKCQSDYYAALRRCPHCGADRAVTIREAYEKGLFGVPQIDPTADPLIGSGLVADYTPLFEKAFAAWYQGDDGFMSCILNFEDGALIIVPPLEDNFYRLARVPKTRDDKVQVLERNEDLASLLMDADRYVKTQAGRVAQKDAAWRTDPASLAQMKLLRDMGVKLKNGATLSKGTASQLITHTLAVRRLIESGN